MDSTEEDIRLTTQRKLSFSMLLEQARLEAVTGLN